VELHVDRGEDVGHYIETIVRKSIDLEGIKLRFGELKQAG